MAAVPLDVRLHRRALDRDLGAGIAAWRSPAHAARASQLTSRRHRRRLADALDGLRAPPAHRAFGAVEPCVESIRGSAEQLGALAARLRSNSPIAPAGIVRLQALVSDGAGPVYAPGQADELAAALTLAERWLDPGE